MINSYAFQATRKFYCRAMKNVVRVVRRNYSNLTNYHLLLEATIILVQLQLKINLQIFHRTDLIFLICYHLQWHKKLD